jgi:hypothetical protein
MLNFLSNLPDHLQKFKKKKNTHKQKKINKEKTYLHADHSPSIVLPWKKTAPPLGFPLAHPSSPPPPANSATRQVAATH